MMRLLCRVGLHRWEYEQNYLDRRKRSGELVHEAIVSARCRRDCPTYGFWRTVNKSHARSTSPEQPRRW